MEVVQSNQPTSQRASLSPSLPVRGVRRRHRGSRTLQQERGALGRSLAREEGMDEWMERLFDLVFTITRVTYRRLEVKPDGVFRGGVKGGL